MRLTTARATWSLCRGWQSSIAAGKSIPVHCRIAFRPSVSRFVKTDKDIVLDLQPLIDRSYQNGRYWMSVPPQVPGPPLSEEDARMGKGKNGCPVVILLSRHPGRTSADASARHSGFAHAVPRGTAGMAFP